MIQIKVVALVAEAIEVEAEGKGGRNPRNLSSLASQEQEEPPNDQCYNFIYSSN